MMEEEKHMEQLIEDVVVKKDLANEITKVKEVVEDVKTPRIEAVEEKAVVLTISSCL